MGIRRATVSAYILHRAQLMAADHTAYVNGARINDRLC